MAPSTSDSLTSRGRFFQSEKLVVVSIFAFSCLIIIDYFLHKNNSIHLVPLSFLIILLFFMIPSWRQKFSDRPLAVFFLSAFPLACYAYLYKLAGSLVHFLSRSWNDETLASLDRTIFGLSPNLTIARCYHPWLTELMMFTYLAYLPLVVVLAYILFREKGPGQLEAYIISLGVAYIICFIIFLLFPAASPRFYFSSYLPESGYLFRKLMNLVENSGQYRGGSFPSAHCAAGTVMIVYSWRASRKAFLLISPLIFLFFISTVYGQYHYAVDVMAGMIIGLLAILVIKLIFRTR
jgi:membrane-associated phospholipid phosphatase